MGRGKTVAEAVKKIGVTEQMEEAATPVTVTRPVPSGNGGRQSSVASSSLLTIPTQTPEEQV